MKILAALVTLALAFPAMATVSSGDAFKSFDHHVNANFSFTRGGAAFGGDYEYGYRRTYGIGAYFRLYSKDDSNGADGMTTVGAFVRPHFHRGSWDLHFTGGFGMHSISYSGGDSETAIGPSFGYGLLYSMTEAFSIGMEHMSHAGWFADKRKGTNLVDLALKARFSF